MFRVIAASALAVCIPWSVAAAAQTAVGAAARPAAATDIEQAVRRALSTGALSRSAGASLAAARAARLQAGARPVDQVEVDAENLIGTNGIGGLEITAAYARTFERGGKREARIRVAEREIEVAQASALVRRMELAATVERAFADALIGDARLMAASSRLSIERTLAAEAERRVRGYKDPLFVRTRARARVTEAEIAVRAAQRDRDGRYALLAALIDADPETLRLDSADFLMPEPLSSRQLAAAELSLAQAEIARAEAAIALASSRSAGDLTIRGGLRYQHESNDVGLVAGVAIPIGAGRANRGNVERATAERDRLRYEAELLRAERARQVSALAITAESARAEARSINDDVLPRLQQALVEVRAGYSRGGFSFADIQDQARALFEARERLVDALVRHHEARVELDRLTGRFANLGNSQ